MNNPLLSPTNCATYSRWALILLWTFSLALSFSLALRLSSVFVPNDFDVYLNASKALLRGESPYQVPTRLSVSENSSEPFYYLYSPLLAVLLLPLTALSDSQARMVWSGISIFSLVGTALAGVKLQLWSATLAPLVMVFITILPFTIDTITTGQIDTVILMLFAVGCASLSKPRSLVLGATVGTATLLKTSPILLLIPLIFSKETRNAALIAVGCIGAVVLATGFVWGFDLWIDYLSTITSISDGGMSWHNPANRSPAKLIVTAVETVAPSRSPSPSSAMKIATVLLLSPLLVRIFRGPTPPLLHQFAVVVGAISLCSPIVWYHHLLWLMIPVTIAWRIASTKVARSIVVVSALSFGASVALDIRVAAATSPVGSLAEEWALVLVAAYFSLTPILLARR